MLLVLKVFLGILGVLGRLVLLDLQDQLVLKDRKELLDHRVLLVELELLQGHH